MKEYFNLIDLVNDNGGVENFRFFMRLETYEALPFFSFLSSNTGKFKLMECRIEEDDEPIHSLTKGRDYKCHVVPVDERYSKSGRLFYNSDLVSDFRSGEAIIKQDGYKVINDIKFGRPIANNDNMFSCMPIMEYFVDDVLYDEINHELIMN